MARTVVIEEPSPHEPLPLAAQAAAGSIRNLLEDLTAHLAPADTQQSNALYLALDLLSGRHNNGLGSVLG